MTPPTTDQTIGRGTGNTAGGEVTPPTTDQTIGRGTGNTARGEVTPPTTDQTIGRGTRNTTGGATGTTPPCYQATCRLGQHTHECQSLSIYVVVTGRKRTLFHSKWGNSIG